MGGAPVSDPAFPVRARAKAPGRRPALRRQCQEAPVSFLPPKISFPQRLVSCFNPAAMRVLVIGSGGREHALVWKLAQSPHVRQMWCAPGNAGIAEERLAKNQSLVECIALGAEELPRLLAFAQEKQADLTVVGPDNPLALG